MTWKNDIQGFVNGCKEKVVELSLESETIKYSSRIKSHRDLKEVTGNEEIVRAYLIARLVNQLGYKAELIELEKEYEAGRPKKIAPRIDVIVRDSKGGAFFFIEVKAPEKFESDKDYIEGQLFKLAKFEKGVKYLVYYTIQETDDGIKDKLIAIDYSAFKEYDEWVEAGSPSIADELPAQYNKPQKPPLTKGGKYDLKKKLDPKEIKALATDLHNVLWGGGGTGDTEIFVSLVNIILAKIQDENDRVDGEDYQFQVLQFGNEIESPSKIFDRVNGLYREALQTQLNITESLDDQFVINRQKFPLNKLVYTVQRLEQYSFIDAKSTLDGKDILGDFFEQIQRDGFKQTKGQFFTPMNVVRFLLYGLEIDNLALKRLNEDRELPYTIDPSCGSGSFLIECMKTITQEMKHRRKDEIKTSRQVQDKFEQFFLPDNKEHRWAREYIYGVEHNFDLGTATKVNMILHGDGSTNIFVKDGLLPFRFYEKTTAPNFLRIGLPDSTYDNREVNGQFDVIVSNPPFSVNLDNETKKYLKNGFYFHAKKNSENLFVERYYQLLKEGGRLGVVLPESIFDTSENKYIRLFLYKYFYIRAVVSIPQLTFEPYTSTKTSLLFAQKKPKSEVEKWNKAWSKQASEWGKLRTRAENYIKVFCEGEEQSKFPSIKDDDEKTVKKNIAVFIKRTMSPEENSLSVIDFVKKHQAEIEDMAQVDNDTRDVFGFVNTTWVFEEVAKELSYPIFMAEAENIGYKRTKRGEKPQPNDLFDFEIAPETLDIEKVKVIFDEEKKGLEELKLKLEEEIKKTDGKRKVMLLARLKKVKEDLVDLQTERTNTLNTISQYYDKNGNLRVAYKPRHISELNSLFQSSKLEQFKSNFVLIRQAEHSTILDFMRKAKVWA